MIRRSVEQRPDDGYIVDSLGWAYFRIGNYEEAVKNLERAVELKPDDPTINDHLGDAYWRIGRTLEAHFQWSHAKDLKPETDDLPKIEEKLKDGLPPDTAPRLQMPTSRRRPATAGDGLSSPEPLVENAPAKVNLTLRVLGRRADGYHELESLVAFAEFGDRLSFTPGGELALTLSGPSAALAGRQRRQSGAARPRGRLPSASRHTARRLPPRKGVAGRGRDRRRLGRCGGGAAAPRAGERAVPAAIRGFTKRPARPAPTCRSASIRARG